jgi:tRNA (guanine37-N1)-methyltransferase
VLISGHHANVAVWRRQEALRRTFERRPDLLEKIELSKQDIAFINGLKLEKQQQGNVNEPH